MLENNNLSECSYNFTESLKRNYIETFLYRTKFIFLQCSKAEIWTPHSKILKRSLQVIKSLKHDNVNNLCFCLKLEQSCQIIPSKQISNLRYRSLKPKN